MTPITPNVARSIFGDGELFNRFAVAYLRSPAFARWNFADYGCDSADYSRAWCDACDALGYTVVYEPKAVRRG